MQIFLINHFKASLGVRYSCRHTFNHRTTIMLRNVLLKQSEAFVQRRQQHNITTQSNTKQRDRKKQTNLSYGVLVIVYVIHWTFLVRTFIKNRKETFKQWSIERQLEFPIDTLHWMNTRYPGYTTTPKQCTSHPLHALILRGYKLSII